MSEYYSAEVLLLVSQREVLNFTMDSGKREVQNKVAFRVGGDVPPRV
jgi:hypothetical protein